MTTTAVHRHHTVPVLTRRELAQLRTAEALYGRETIMEPSEATAGDEVKAAGDYLVSLAMSFIQHGVCLVHLAAQLVSQLACAFARALFRRSSSSATTIWHLIRFVAAILLFAPATVDAAPGRRQFSMPRTRALSFQDFQAAHELRPSTLRRIESFESSRSRPCHRRSHSLPGGRQSHSMLP